MITPLIKHLRLVYKRCFTGLSFLYTCTVLTSRGLQNNKSFVKQLTPRGALSLITRVQIQIIIPLC